MNQNDREFLVQKIRTQYTEKKYTQLDALKALDKKVKKPATVFACVFGSMSAIIMGVGMSLVMTDIGATVGIANPMLYGIVIGFVGVAGVALAYPLYVWVIRKEREKVAPEILRLTDELMK